MKKKDIRLIITVIGFIGAMSVSVMAAPPQVESPVSPDQDKKTENESRKDQAPKAGPPLPAGAAGDFLASYHAQTQYDWSTAQEFVDHVLSSDPENLDLLRRSMILSMGAGDLATAALRATKILSINEGPNATLPPSTVSEPQALAGALELIILTIDSLQKNDLDGALAYLEKMPPGDMTNFVNPLLKGWIMSARGKEQLLPETLNDVSVHLFHGALMAMLRDDKSEARKLTEKLSGLQGLSAFDAERAGDLYAVLGDKPKAMTLYEAVRAEAENESLEDKIKALKDGGPALQSLIDSLSVKSAQQGIALVMYDMAYILYLEQTDSSTKLFAHMALALNPNLIEARLLLGDTLARNGRLEEAISFLQQVPKGHKSYIGAQRYAASLLSEAGKEDEARQVLNDLFVNYNDVESLIRIGDIYRAKEKFKDAVETYNRAAQAIGAAIPEDYWHLLYARGMAYEREGQWEMAEKDLKAALAFRPNHPYLLNYLGYGWADQGKNLEESLRLIERAASLRPSDGYITDSLGWVYYMMGRYQDAVPHLERAVELLPYDSTINDHLGDAYWMIGRQMEARFQWERALNHAESDAERAAVADKLKVGITHTPISVKEKQANGNAVINEAPQEQKIP